MFVLTFLFSSLAAQSCFLAPCATNECGHWNVSFSPQGGVAFCENTAITFTNTSDPGFDYFVFDWSDGQIDTVYSYESVIHIYSIADSLLCEGNELLSVCFQGIKECSEGQSCAWGSYSFMLKARPKAILNLYPEYCVMDPIHFDQVSCNGESYVWDFGDGSSSTEEFPTHQYVNPGIYSINLTVQNECGLGTTSQQVSLIECPVGTQKIPIAPDFIIYPNPAQNYIFVQPVSSKSTGFIFQLRNSAGKEVLFREELTRNDKIDLSQLTKGIYILTITSKEGQYSKLFVKT